MKNSTTKVYELDRLPISGGEQSTVLKEVNSSSIIDQKTAEEWINTKGMSNANYVILEVYQGQVSNIL